MRTIEKKGVVSSPIIEKDVAFVAKQLLNGKVIAFPTDTVFGLACVYDDRFAIEKIKTIKGRDENKPLPMMVSSVHQLNQIAMIDEKSKKLFEKLTPGALTLIVEKNANLPEFVNNGFNTIAIRIPNDPFILELISQVGKPLLVTSANRSNAPTGTSVDEVLAQIFNEIDYIVEGECISKISSTIVDCTNNFNIIRIGDIQEQTIKEVIS